MTGAAGTRVLLAAVIIVVAAAVLGGLLLVGSPGEQRLRKLDARRIADLQAVARSIRLHWLSDKALPASLVALDAERRPALTARDPETGEPYTYRVTGERSYELCATFRTQSAEEDAGVGDLGITWEHGRGPHCFRLQVRNGRD